MYKELRDELISLNVDTTKLDEIAEQVKETKYVYKVYIHYEFFGEEYTAEERFVLYTEDKSLADRYFDFLQEVEKAFMLSYGEISADFYTPKFEKILIYNYKLERCPFCGEPVDRSKGYYCPNCGST